jgi:hypothetical protein
MSIDCVAIVAGGASGLGEVISERFFQFLFHQKKNRAFLQLYIFLSAFV